MISNLYKKIWRRERFFIFFYLWAIKCLNFIVVPKRKKEAESEWVKGGHKSVKKSSVKKESVIKRAIVKLKPIKGPGPRVKKPVEEKVMTREEHIEEMENQNVLNDRVFDPEILTEISMSTLFYSVSLQSWDHLFEAAAPYLHEPEVREFYYKMELLSDGGLGVLLKRSRYFWMRKPWESFWVFL